MAKLSQFSTCNKNSSDHTDNGKQNFSQDDLKEKFDSYKDLSKEELNAKLFNEVARQKMQGTFDYAGLEKMVESIKGGLTEEQYSNIMRLLESLK